MISLNSFQPLLNSYSVFFFDIYGVFRTEKGVDPRSHKLFRLLRENNKSFWFITNDASRSPSEIATQISGAENSEKIDPEQIICSGLMIQKHLEKRHFGETVAYLGPQKCEYYIKAAGAHPLPFQTHPSTSEFSAFALMDNDGFEWKTELNRVVNLALQQPQLPLLAPNPDIIYPSGNGEYALASGALSFMVGEAVGRPFQNFGKPENTIFAYAFAQAQKQVPDLRKEQCLMIGDTLHADIMGATRFGLKSLLVLSGNTKAANLNKLSDDLKVKPDYLAESVFI